MTLLGLSAGIPFYLIFSSLSIWLGQVGVAKSAITYFSWAALGYSFKFLWSPLVDKMPLPFFSKWLGQRRGWLLFVQLLVISAIVWMAMIDPSKGDSALTLMAFAAVLLGFSAATQDILIDAWRIEASNKKDIGILSSLYFIGYRLGMILSGAGALVLAHKFGSTNESYSYEAWRNSYLIMSSVMLVGVYTTFSITEPKRVDELTNEFSRRDYFAVLLIFLGFIVSFILAYTVIGRYEDGISSFILQYINNTVLVNFMVTILKLAVSFALAVVIGFFIHSFSWVNKVMINETYIRPIQDLLVRHKKYAWLLIAIIFTYRISDIVLGVVANLFYLEMGFDLDEIAKIVKTFGVFMTLLGGFLGGLAVVKFGVIRLMILGAVLSALTNLLFMWMTYYGKSNLFLIFMISADNLSQGLALTSFIAFLSLLVNKHFTAVQYAMFSSVMTLFPKIIGGYSGGMVENLGFSQFFLMTTIIGIPVVILLFIAQRNEEMMKNFITDEQKQE